MEFDNLLQVLKSKTMLFGELFKSFIVFFNVILVLFSHFFLLLFRQFTKNLVSLSEGMVNKGSLSLKFWFWNDKIFLNFSIFLVKSLSLCLELFFFLLCSFAKVFLHDRSSFSNIFWFCGHVSIHVLNG